MPAHQAPWPKDTTAAAPWPKDTTAAAPCPKDTRAPTFEGAAPRVRHARQGEYAQQTQTRTATYTKGMYTETSRRAELSQTHRKERKKKKKKQDLCMPEHHDSSTQKREGD